MKQSMEYARTLAKSPAVAIFEIAFVVLCVLIAEWAILPFFGRNLRVFALPVSIVIGFGFISHLARREKAADLGLRLDNFPAALQLLLPMMFGAAALLILIGALAGSLAIRFRADGHLAQTVLWLLLWGFLQQYALQAIINRRAQQVWGEGVRSVLFVALVFALLHLPNPALVLATFTGGCIWAYVYQRIPNLFALTLSHCLMTLLLVGTLPPHFLHKMRVGIGYYY